MNASGKQTSELKMNKSRLKTPLKERSINVAEMSESRLRLRPRKTTTPLKEVTPNLASSSPIQSTPSQKKTKMIQLQLSPIPQASTSNDKSEFLDQDLLDTSNVFSDIPKNTKMIQFQLSPSPQASTLNDKSELLDQDLLDTSNIFSDIPKNAKFSIPARLLGTLKSNIPHSRGSKLISKASNVPASKSSSNTAATATKPTQEETTSPQKKRLTNLTVDNCFGFNDELYEVPQQTFFPSRLPTVQRKPHILCETENLPPIEKVKEMLMSTITEADITEAEKSSSDSEDDVREMPSDQSTSMHLFEDVAAEETSFTQPPRHSYRRVRNAQRTIPSIVTSDKENEPEEEEFSDEEKRRKRTKMRKRTKKAKQSSLVDEWAKSINSHFAEVEETELLVE